MARVRVSFTIRRTLSLAAGLYANVELECSPDDGTATLALWFEPRSEGAFEEQESQSERLLVEANRFLRWYRFVTGEASVVELTDAQASPFRFVSEPGGAPWGGNDGIRYAVPEHAPAARTKPLAQVESEIRAGLQSAVGPPVWHLLVLDADVAFAEGRNREAVIFCWSAIESCFNTTFRDLVQTNLTDLNRNDRDSLASGTGRDISLTNRMTAGLQLAAGQSLHRLLGSDWERLRASYRVRNRVVHEGGEPSPDEAERCLAVTRRVLREVEALRPAADGE
ncbi:MAG: hypothetical protein HYU66_17520 [Armatimonadetes bacterium]|nr:hypothetical protein [Armatimonadota bacterium]